MFSFHDTIDRRRAFVVTLILLVGASSVAAEDEQKDRPIQVANVDLSQPVDFETQILPLLRQNCLACHNQAEAESDLVLETPQSIKTGGASGAAVVPGKSDQSMLLQVAAHRDEPIMPPADNEVGAKNLTPEQLGLIKLWIDQGAEGEVSDGAHVQWQPPSRSVHPIYATAISPDGDCVLVGRDNRLFLYHVGTRKLVTQLVDQSLKQQAGFERSSAAHLDLIRSVAADPSGRRFATGGYRTVKIWQKSPIRIEREFTGVGQSITSLIVNHDGLTMAVGRSDGAILLIDLEEGKVQRELKGHQRAIVDMWFSQNGQRLCTAGEDQTVRLWNTSEGLETAVFETKSKPTAVVLIDEEKRIAVCDVKGAIHIWQLDSTDDAQPTVVKGAEGPVAHLLAVGTQPERFVTIDKERTIQFWDASTVKSVHKTELPAPIVAATCSTVGGKCITLTTDRTANVYNVADGSLLATTKVDVYLRRQVARAKLDLDIEQRVLEGARRDRDDTQRQAESADESARKAQQAAAQAETDLQRTEAATVVSAANEAAASKRLATAQEIVQAAESASKQAASALARADELVGRAKSRLDDAQNNATAQTALTEAKSRRDAAKSVCDATDRSFKLAGQQVKNLEEELKQLHESLNKARNAQRASELQAQATRKSMSRTKSEFVRLTELAHLAAQEVVRNEKLVHSATGRHKQLVQDLDQFDIRKSRIASSADGSSFAVVDQHGRIATFEADGTPVDVAVTNQAAPCVGFAWLANGQLLTATDKSKILTWQTGEWELERTIGGPESDLFDDRVTALDFGPKGEILATGGGQASRAGELKLWNVASGELLRTFEASHDDTVMDIEFSYDGRYLASCGADRFMKVFDTKSGDLVKSFEGHTDYVLGVSWQADGRMLVTCGADKAIKVWDFGSGQQHKTISGFKKELTAIRFLGSSDAFVVCGGNNEVQTRNTNGGGGPGFGGAIDFVHSVSASAAGDIVVAGGDDGVLRIWHRDGKSIAVFEPPTDVENAGAPNDTITN